MPTFKDNYGDTLEVSVENSDYVYISVSDDDESVQVEYNSEDAINIADAIYEAAGKETRELPAGAIAASEISLNEALIRVAAVNNVHVTFRYAKTDRSPIEVRTFIPESVRDQGDHVTFLGQDTDRHGLRSFRSDRIKGTVQVVA